MPDSIVARMMSVFALSMVARSHSFVTWSATFSTKRRSDMPCFQISVGVCRTLSDDDILRFEAVVLSRFEHQGCFEMRRAPETRVLQDSGGMRSSRRPVVRETASE